MDKQPLILIENKIPFIENRLEPFARVEYIDTEAFTAEKVANADAIIVRTRNRCDKALLGGSNVKLVVTATIGLDHIDMAWCKSAGITYSNAPGCNAPAVAQYVWASVIEAGLDPSKITCGIIGCGHVGTITAEWGRLLGAKILVNDPPRLEAATIEPSEHTDLETLLKESDVVTLHTPLTKDGTHPSYHLIGAKEIGMMRHGALLINAARGAVLNTIEAAPLIEAGQIRAGIDCWEGEPTSIDNILLHHTLLHTPHIAGYSLQGKQRATRMAVETVARFFGFKGVKTDDLPPAYTPLSSLTADEITNSYSPTADSRTFIEKIGNAPCRKSVFEQLRDNYNLRNEPKFCNFVV